LYFDLAKGATDHPFYIGTSSVINSADHFEIQAIQEIIAKEKLRL